MSASTAQVFVAIGANIDAPEQRVREAIERIAVAGIGGVIARSSLYRNPPVGRLDQPDFVNAMIELRTALSPLSLMQALLALESDMGRVRTERNGPRRIDLDLIAFDARRLSTSELVLPHPRAAERAFVMLPWRDLAPRFVVPGCGSVSDLASRLLPAELHRLDA